MKNVVINKVALFCRAKGEERNEEELPSECNLFVDFNHYLLCELELCWWLCLIGVNGKCFLL